MSNSIIWNFQDNSSLDGYTLIVPSVAVGNVGQLACDLLISSLKMKKIASVYSQALIPVIGYDPYDLNSSRLSSSCELYKNEALKMIALQLRAPLVYKYSQIFLQELVSKLKELNLKDIVILTSSYAHEKKHISTSPFRFAVNDSSPYTSKMKSLDWTEHENMEPTISILGGGFASLLFVICTEKSVPCTILYKYCSEGDNIPDAYEMLFNLNNILPLFSDKGDFLTQLVQPVSWKLLFGRPPPQDIY